MVAPIYQLVQKELENRASGKSLGPLTSKEQDSLFDFRTQFEKFDFARLSQEYVELQQVINKTIEVDIQQIGKIPFITLLKIAAIYMLLQKQQQQRNTDNNNDTNNTPQTQRVSPTQSMSSIGRGLGTYTPYSNMPILSQGFQTMFQLFRDYVAFDISFIIYGSHIDANQDVNWFII